MRGQLQTIQKEAYSLMTISSLSSLLFQTVPSYEQNLATLLGLVAKTKQGEFIVAPEVCLTGYDYENLQGAANFTKVAIEELKKATQNKALVVTMLTEKEKLFYNTAYVFYNGEVVHTQPKAKLFKFGEEHCYLQAGVEEDIIACKLGSLHVGVLICFELRFKHLWQKLEGVDIVAVPSLWGILREQNYKVLTTSLAIMNQCYVVCSDSQNAEFTRQSGVITPFGKEYRNEGEPIRSVDFDPKEIKAMRRYMDTGITPCS